MKTFSGLYRFCGLLAAVAGVVIAFIFLQAENYLLAGCCIFGSIFTYSTCFAIAVLIEMAINVQEGLDAVQLQLAVMSHKQPVPREASEV